MRIVAVFALLGLVVAGCSKESPQNVPESVQQQSASEASSTDETPAPSPPDEEQDAAKLAEYLDTRLECAQFKERLAEAGRTPVADASTGEAFATIMAEANKAGCVIPH